MDAPKTAICVGLQDDYKFSFKPGYEHDYPASGHDNIMSIEMYEDMSSNTSFEENSNYTSQSDNKNSINSIQLHKNCCSSYNANYQINNENSTDEQDEEDVKHVFDNDEFIIVPHVPAKLITSHCNLHSGLIIFPQLDNELLTTPTTSDSCNSSPAPSSSTANTTNSSGDSNYKSANHLAATATVTSSTLAASCHRDDMLNFQCFMQKCAH